MNQAADSLLAVRASGLVKRYGQVVAVDGLDLDIPSGQFFGLLGPNGSGKTSTIHMLATLIRPSGGSARVAGHDVVDAAVKVRGAYRRRATPRGGCFCRRVRTIRAVPRSARG